MSALYWIGNSLFLAEAINIGYPVNPDSIKDTREFLLTANTKLQVFLVTVWTATFAVKFSFLTFFKTLIRKEFSPRMNKFFWFTIVFTLATWGFLVSEGFILCPYFGLDSTKCYPTSNSVDNTTRLTILITVLDIFTDFLIVSFPAVILYRAKMTRAHKWSMGSFLSLSLVMVGVTLVRVVGSIRPGRAWLDLSWELFWQQMEGCTAVLMGSITAFRSAFNRGGPTQNPEHGAGGKGLRNRTPQSSSFKWNWLFVRKTREAENDEETGSTDR